MTETKSITQIKPVSLAIFTEEQIEALKSSIETYFRNKNGFPEKLKEAEETQITINNLPEITERGINFDIHGELKSTLKKIVDEIETDEKINFITSSLHALHATCTRTKSEMIKPIQDTIDQINDKFTRYRQEVKRQEAIERERKRLEQIAAEKAAKEKILAEAAKLEADGHKIDDAAVLKKIEQVYIPQANTPIEKKTFENVKFRKVRTVEVVDVLELCKAIVNGAIPTTCVKPSKEHINAWVTSHGIEDNTINGIKVKTIEASI